MYGIYPAKLFGRVAAFVLDCIIIFVTLVAFENLVMSKISNKVWDYDNLMKQYEQYQIDYGIAYYDEDGNYVSVSDVSDETWDAFKSNTDIQKIAAKISYVGMIDISVDLFVGELLAFLIFPLIFKDGRTLGLKMMHMGLIGTSNGLRVKFWQVLARFLIGFYAVESVLTVGLVYLIGPFGLVIVLASTILMFATKKHLALHDIIAGTQVVDLERTIIYDNPGEREAHAAEYAKEKEHEEEKRRQNAMKYSQNSEKIGLILPRDEDEKEKKDK